MDVSGFRSTQTGRSASVRAVRIQAVLQELLSLDETAWPDDAALAQRYPELMPDLSERLRMLRAIRAAAAQAASRPATPDGEDLPHAVGEDDLRFLRDELSDYDVLERVQYGGQGIVYKAVQRVTKRIVALKVLLDGPLATARQRARFTREVELCSRLQHPNIVTLYDSGAIRGRNYCAMEFVEGLPIDEYVLLHAPSAKEIVRLFVTVCWAISYAHQRGIIHRDLSPANLMIDLVGEPRVLDFGLAKDAWTDADEGPAISITGQVVGTLPYLSPEQTGGLDGQVDVRSDIYSLGVVLYQLLSGSLPYPGGGNPATLRDQIQSADPVPLRATVRRNATDLGAAREGVTRDLEMILAKTLAKDKSRRYQSAAALAEDLQRYLAGDAVEAHAESRLYLLRKAVRRHRLAFGVTAAFMLALGAAGAAVTMLWIEAAAQRDNARQATRVAHSMFDKVVTEVDGAIRPLAGGVAVRDRLLGYASAELPALESLVASDPQLGSILEKLHERQGDIAATQGRRSEAEQHYRQFLDAAVRESTAQPGRTDLLGDLVRAHRKLAGVAAEGDEHYGQAVELATRLVREHAGDIELKYGLCQTQIEFGWHLYGRGAYKDAAQQIDAAIALARTLSPGDDEDERWDTLMALARERESDVWFRIGDTPRAISALEECLRLRRRLSTVHPADVDCRHKLSRACIVGGSTYREAGRPDDARRLLEEAVAAGEYLTLVEPSVSDWTHDLIVAHDALTLVSLDAKDAERAAPHSEAAIRIAERLSESDPANATWAGLLAMTRMRRGELLLLRGELEAARTECENAVLIHRRASMLDPENPGLKADLAFALDSLGSSHRRLRDTDKARECYQEGYEIRRSLYESRPDVFERRMDFILSQMKMATWHLDQRTAQHDALGAELLDQAERALLALEATGQLGSRQGRYAGWLPAIHKNQQLIAERSLRRSGEDPDPSGNSVPTSSPTNR